MPNISKLQLNYFSPGGDITNAAMLYNYIRSLIIPVRMVNTSFIASAGVLIYLAADELYTVKNSNLWYMKFLLILMSIKVFALLIL